MGTLQYRTFPTPNEAHKNRNAFASSDNTIEPRGYDGTSTDRVHPLHQPLNIDAEAKSPVVACIRAFPKNQLHRSSHSTSTSTSTSAAHSKSNSNGTTSSSSSSSSSSSIYLLLQNNKQINTSAKKEGAYASQIVALHHMTNSSTTLFSSQNLPKMSCVAYHPNTGFVYAAGANISSLPSKVVRAISSALASNSGGTTIGGAGGGVHGIVKKEEEIMARPTVYYNAIAVLPSPVRSNPDAICATCDGRVIVVASGNAFYAVSGTSVPHGTWYTKEEEEHMEEAKGNEHDHDGMVGAYGGGFGVGGGGGEGDDGDEGEGHRKGHDVEKVLKFRQSSQVHPAIVVEVPEVTVTGAEEGEVDGNVDRSLYGGHGSSGSMSFDMGADEEAFTSLLFLASGRECAVVELLYNPRLYSNSGNKNPVLSADDPEDRVILPSSSISCGSIVVGSPRGGIATFASPILAAVGIQSTSKRTGPLMAILTNDGLVQTRSPSCIAIPLSTIEVGTSPNDYFALRALPNKEAVAVSYGGEGRLILFREDTVQDLADRMMKLSIDAFGSSGFPRTELSKSVEAKFSATSYVGPEPTNSARTILRQYLEMVLGLDIHGDFNGGDATSWFFDDDEEGTVTNSDYLDLQGSRSRNASTFVSATAVLCLVCTELAPSNPSLANRAAKSCATKIGVVSNVKDSGINTETVALCKQIVERLLTASESHKVEVTSAVPTRSNATPTRSKVGHMEFVEAATWLLRACGEHHHAIDIQQKKLANPAVRNSTNARELPPSRGAWSQIKYESFLASHLGELWSYGDESTRELVLESPATRQLLESNPLLGLGVFTASHPGNEDQWRKLVSREDPAASNKFPKRVVELLKSIRPLIPHDKRERIVQIQSSAFSQENKCLLPLESGRALTVTYLESLVGISTKKPTMKDSSEFIENITEMHNELALLLLEGVLSERTDVESEGDSALGSLYRSKLRRLLGWSNAAVNPDTLMSALPASFLRERALVLGQLGRHEDALRIFYCELKSLDLALEYCDARFEKQQVQISFDEKSSLESKAVFNDSIPTACPYLPLVAVALKTDKDPDAGIAAAIKVLSLRRQNINRSAALRLLPKNIPIAALSQSVLVPALIEGESQARRMEVVSSLLRAKYVRLKRVLTETQITSQSSLHTVPGLKSLNLGEPIYISKPFKARPSNIGLSHFPDISITKYFFARYVVIQASVMNSSPSLEGKTLGEVQLIVAESSDDALLPSINISVKVLPPELSGCSWCVLAASPQRLDGSAILACELRYKILDVDSATGAPLSFGGGSAKSSRSFVEEIQDIEIRRAEFEG